MKLPSNRALQGTRRKRRAPEGGRYAASYGALEKHCQSSVGSLAMR